MKIDAHQHFWKYNQQDFAWIDDSMTSIKKDFLPQDLIPILENNGFEGSVLVQVNQNEQENEYFLDLASQNPFIKGLVSWVELKDSKLSQRLEYYASKPMVKGFRHIVQAENEGFMDDPAFVQGIQTLAQFGFTYDILIFPNQLKEAIRLIKNCPANNFVLDHMAKPYIKDGKISQWSNYIMKMGEFPNVYCKVSGMVTEAHWHSWKKEDFYIYLDTVLTAFGVDRIMYGSDWPVCLLAAQYEEQLEIVQSYFEKLTESEKDKIFGGNAVKFYRL